MMKTGRYILETLKEYDVKHVFGLPGETTLEWYLDWCDFPEITHIMARDERSAAYMADAYARASFKPGICEGPSVGSTHLIPGVAEAYKASVPMIVFTTDVPLGFEQRNMLTGLDQTLLFRPITKETLTVNRGSDLAFLLRRAFRLATTGKPGPVHLRIPSDILSEEIANPKIVAQKDFATYPGHRPVAETEKIKQAVKLLGEAQNPVFICGQGVLYSQAWEEVVKLAELFGVPVGTTMTGKGSISELHPLSIGVIGARGGTSFSNKIVKEADLVFFVGCNTDSAGTAKWTLPSQDGHTKIIHLDISEVEVGNNYYSDVILIGDAKATLETAIEIAQEMVKGKKYNKLPRIEKIHKEAAIYESSLQESHQSTEKPINPLRFTQELSKAAPNKSIIVADAGVGTIHVSAFYKTKKAGRNFIFNYSVGALGYAIPASVGAHCARPDDCVITLTGDGSFGFAAGELETISRIGGNINIIVFNNGCFGWIKGAIEFSYGSKSLNFATNFKEIDYQKIGEGFGIRTYKIEDFSDTQFLWKAFETNEPTLIEVKAKPECELVPPVPEWAKKAKERQMKCTY